MPAARTISVPDFDFTGFYYPELLEDLVNHLRTNVPEITNEDPAEPAMQLLSAFALVAHLNNTLLDVVAHESLLATAQLRESVANHLALIDFEVAGDVPASVELLLTLSKTFLSTTQVVPAGALFATKRTSTSEPVVFEADASVSVNPTNVVTAAFVFDASGLTYTDVTTQTNTDALTFAGLPATPAPGDILYIGHDTAMTNRLKVVDITTAMADVFGVWEYHDGDFEDDAPDSVTVLGSQLKVIIDAMLDTDGTTDYTGLEVQVQVNQTGAKEVLTSAHDGTNNFVLTSGFLGQTTPSIDPNDYTVGAEWHRLPELDDDTNDGNTTLEVEGNIDFAVPKSQVDNWQPGEVNAITAFWARFRVVSVGGFPVAPVMDRIQWNKRNTFVQVDATQGQSRSQTLGSSSGEVDQEFQLSSSPVIPDTVAVTVDGDEWEEVDNFLNSTGVDQHYRVEVDSDGIGTVIFGDGVNGKVPPVGVNNVAAEYRTDAELNGNVGANTITINRSGVSNVKTTTNPRAAQGWVQRRGATSTDLELLKLEGPASLRVLRRAVSPSDVEYLSVQFVASDGSRPFVRAKAIEEGGGLKTVSAILVGSGGDATPPSVRQELEVYFNGDAETGASGVMVANQRVVALDYTPISINVTATVTGGNQESIESALESLLSPVALLEDGITFRWGFGQTVTLTKIIATIFAADSDVEDVVLTSPAANVLLDEDELPVLGTLTITVV